ncbi:hypothetical protein A6A25_01330 [Saccharothrix sp. CB00851]|nr:hypothetical protein A6A25_01330 [Saccharothrix sp. CB00851]
MAKHDGHSPDAVPVAEFIKRETFWMDDPDAPKMVRPYLDHTQRTEILPVATDDPPTERIPVARHALIEWYESTDTE